MVGMPVSGYNTSQKRYAANGREVVWPGGIAKVPMDFQCPSGFILGKGGKCALVEDRKARVYMGITAGVLFALLVLSLLVFVIKNPV